MGSRSPQGRAWYTVVSLVTGSRTGSVVALGMHRAKAAETASRAVAVFRREGLLVNLDRQGRHFRVDAEGLEAIGTGGAPE